MRKSKAERAAELLDAEMRINFSNLRARLYVTTKDIRALDAVLSLAGEAPIRCDPGTASRWRCEREGAILQLLQKCASLMWEQRELAEAVIEFLEATTAEGMFNAMTEVWSLRKTGRTGRRGSDNW